MTTKERMVRSQTSSNLGEAVNGEFGDIDIVRATGMVGQSNPIGVSLWRLKYAGDSAEFPKVVTALAEMLAKRNVKYKDALLLALNAVKHYVDDVCKPCVGRGYDIIPGTPVLSDQICTHCRGAGRAPFEHTGDESEWLEVTISRMEREVAGAVMKKLAAELDF